MYLCGQIVWPEVDPVIFGNAIITLWDIREKK